MIPRSLINQVEKQVPYLIKSYGGANNFIRYIKQNLDITRSGTKRTISNAQYQNAINYLYTILEKKDEILLISPWSFIFDLATLEDTQSFTPDSIDFDIPYTVHDLQGNLLYTVKQHNGFFGRSQLDKLLMNRSTNTSAYFLKYITFNGTPRVKLILINLFTREVLVQSELLQTVESLNQSNITFANFSNSPVVITTYETTPSSNPNLTDIFNLGFNEEVQPNTSRSFVPRRGTWFLIQTPNLINRTQITNSDNDIFIRAGGQVGTYELYYFGLNVNTALLNRVFNIGLDYSDKRVDEIIEIT